jgi:tetratricopeptide (TPR) repeat protein
MRLHWLLLLVLVLTAGVAQADSKKTSASEREARHLFERAEAHFKSGLYAEALAEYQSGYAASPLPGFLINIAQCQRRLGDLDQARTTYRKFILVAPDSRFVPDVKALIVELDKLLDERAADQPAATTAPPEAQPEPVSAPTVATAPPTFDAGKTPQPEPKAQSSLVTTPTPPAPAQAEGTRWWLWGTLGAAVIAGATTAYLVTRDPGTTTLHDGSLGTLRR